MVQVLRFVDDQQHLAAARVLLDQELVQRREHLGLLHLERRKSKLHQHGLQERGRRQLGLVDLRDDDVFLKFAQEGFDQSRLAGADFTGDDHETVGKPDRGLHVRLGACMVFAQI